MLTRSRKHSRNVTTTAHNMKTHRAAGFMKHTIEFGTWVMVDGPMGTEWIPADEMDQDEIEQLKKVIDDEGTVDLDGTRLRKFSENQKAYDLEIVDGYSAYISAPGYMDRTDNVVFKTEEEAKAYLNEYYPEDEDEDDNEEEEDPTTASSHRIVTSRIKAPRSIVYKGARYEKVAAEGKKLPNVDTLASIFWKDPVMQQQFLKALDDAVERSNYDEDLYASAVEALKKAGFDFDEDRDSNTITGAVWDLYKKAYKLLVSNM